MTAGDPRPALAGAIPDLVGQARRDLARDPADPRGLHLLRIALKRMRSLWRLAMAFHSGDEPRIARARLGRAARRLAAARNREVTAGLLREFLGTGSLSPGASPRAHPPRAAAGQAAGLLEASLSAFLAFQPRRGGSRPWRHALAKAYRRARARMPGSESDGDEAFHAWRKAVKDLLYGLEGWPGPRRKRLQGLLAKLEALQQGLGRAQDLSLAEAGLEELSGKEERKAGKGRSSPRKERKRALRRMAAEKENRKAGCLRSGKKLFAKPAGEFRERYLDP